jgi:hypothetical protein
MSEQLGNTKRITRDRKLEKCMQYNGQKKKGKGTNNGLLNTTQKTRLSNTNVTK